MIAVENSTWNNIGDAFYQQSIMMCLQQSLPDAKIVSFDGPFRRAFRPRGFAKNGYDARFATQADHYVFSGPILGEGFFEEYGPLIEHIVAKGASYSLQSIHAYAEDALLERMRAFFKTYPPLAFQTRDTFTFNKFKGLDVPMYDGICFAFFVSKLPNIPTVKPEKPFVAVSFHASPDPDIQLSNNNELPLTKRVTVGPQNKSNWRIRRQFDFRRSYPTTLGEFDIVRPVHSFYPSPHLLFARPSSFITYNPLNFIAIYANCAAVITDRVHAGVAALSHGKPAYVTSLDTRYAIFEHAPVTRSGDFLELDKEMLDTRFSEIKLWLAQAYQSLLVR
ncbi:polysaccharide pyruvyl transferase family protein [uncultured Erythrobacter sp.]|uniref:polysaccharide pyruvyl transferase family protein n=1 Tax=uncultured Erythrobacter sp. TaxID=263913 RepID=UPI002659B556|nr:polysaccharide pyruvyl transferase family protein [uncultured Erythrobacter sp.]